MFTQLQVELESDGKVSVSNLIIRDGQLETWRHRASTEASVSTAALVISEFRFALVMAWPW